MTLLVMQDFPSLKAGQNGSMFDMEKAAERARTRTLAEILIREHCPESLRFSGQFPLSVTVACRRPEEKIRRQPRMDLVNVPGMLKGYFDGFTRGGLWSDDSLIHELKVRWMPREEAEHWARLTETPYEGNGLLLFHVDLLKGGLESGEDDSVGQSADADPEGGDA